MTRRNWGRSINDIKEVESTVLQNHPLPDEYEDDSEFHGIFHTDELPYTGTGLPSNSYGRMSPISMVSYCSETETLTQSCGTSRSLSSASSWTDDGYEQETSEKVQKIFDSIDALLYEGTELPPEYREVHEECLYWRQTYPHLRVNAQPISKTGVGVRDEVLTAAQTASVPSRSSRVSTAVVRDDADRLGSGKAIENLSLMIQGTKLEPLPLPALDEECIAEGVDSGVDMDNSFNSVYEEILMQDGEYEELIAVDYGDVTQAPSAAASDEYSLDNGPDNHLHLQILNRLIECTWQKVVQQVTKVLARCARTTLMEGTPANVTRRVVNAPGSAVAHERPIPRFPTAPASSQNSGNLHGLLTISSKTLLNRSSDRSVRCGTQSSAPAALVGSRLASPHKSVNPSARGRLAPLDKIAKSATQSNISNSSHNDSLTTQPLLIHPLSPPSWGRHFPLPPIESGLHQPSSPMPHMLQRVKPPSSAVVRTYSDPGSKKPTLREPSKARLPSSNRTVTMAQVPSTTFRSTRLLSAVDDVRRYSNSSVIASDRVKSGNRVNESIRIQSGSQNRYGIIPSDRISTSNGTRDTSLRDRPHQNANYLYNTSHFERRSNR